MSWLEQIESYDDLFETRNSKSEARNKRNDGETRTVLKFRFRVRFRISIFGFRIFFRWIPNVLSRPKGDQISPIPMSLMRATS